MPVSSYHSITQGSPGGTSGKEPACQCRRHKETQVWSLHQEDPLEKDMTTHSSILAWRSPWTEEAGRLQSMGSQIVRQDWSDLACTRAQHHSDQRSKAKKTHNYHLGIQSTVPKLENKTGGKFKIRWNLREDKALSGHWQGPPGTQGWHIPLTKATPQLLSEGEFSIQMFIRYLRHAKDIYQIRGWRTYPRAYPRIYTWTLTPGNSQGKCITM